MTGDDVGISAIPRPGGSRPHLPFGRNPPEDGAGRVVFDDSDGRLLGIVVRGFLLTFLTLGIYRFWYITDVRRYFWSRTLIHGAPLEYTGRGIEIFIGFLIALAVLAPLYLLGFLLALGGGLIGSLGASLLGPVFGFLYLFATYRSRRYQVNRTVWRGLRFHQTGSGWGYALRAAGWFLASVFSLGLLVPMAFADLYRYRIERMHLGQVGFAFTGSWRTIAPMHYTLWAIFVLPAVVTALTAGFHAVTGELQFGIKPSAVLIAIGFAYQWMFLGVFAVPYYIARKTSAFFSATELGAVRWSTRISARSLYGIYLLAGVLFVLAISVLFPVLGYLLFSVLRGGEALTFATTALTVAGGILTLAVFYLVQAMLSVLILKRKIWKLIARSTVIANPDRLDDLAGRIRDTETGFGAGLADALDAADFEIGL